MSNLVIPQMAIHPNSIVLYNSYIRNGSGASESYNTDVWRWKEDREERIINSERKAAGILSINARRKLNRAIEYLLFASHQQRVRSPLSGKKVSFRLCFITITLSAQQVHSDAYITQELFNQLLVELRKYESMKSYVWRAEKQRNGNIHYHLITNVWINWTSIRDRWNRIQEKAGYVSRFKEKHGHSNPNSTDIHSLRKVKNIQNYLSKYMSKSVKVEDLETEEQKQKLLVSGRLWSASQNLLNIKGFNLEVDSFIEEMVRRLKTSPEVRIYEDDYFSVLYFDLNELTGTPFEPVLIKFQQYCVNALGIPIQRVAL